MLWAALLPQAPPAAPERRTEPLDGLAIWCLQFTPRVAIVEPHASAPAVVMEVAASLRLFGGRHRLIASVGERALDAGAIQTSWAPTSLGAVSLARAGIDDGLSQPLHRLLDGLPLAVLSAAHRHQATLARIGCRTLGHVRALPRGGLSRRFDADLLVALDQAYGLRPEAHDWVELPETFASRLELRARVDSAPALLHGARRLLEQMCGWLAARHCGTRAFELGWCHDVMRSRSAGDGGSLVVRTATPTRDIEHLARLLAENLVQVQLLAPVGDLALRALDVQPLEEHSLSMLPEPRRQDEQLALVLERIAARLGPERVRRPVVREDHRCEWMTHWQAAPVALPRLLARTIDSPQPTFLLDPPLRLAMRGDRPMYQGVLQLLTGPHRIAGGWWDRAEVAGEETTRNVVRDYWVALSEHAGALWIFQANAEQDFGWFLHGVFA